MLHDIDHVGIATLDLDAAVERYRRAFGIEPAHRETVEDQGVEEVLFRVGTSFVQLLRALGPDTPVGKFLERRGEGVHHVGYRVDDVAAT
ncbi:MAG: VOC family protein, partial [Actinomycetota bacterium]